MKTKLILRLLLIIIAVIYTAIRLYDYYTPAIERHVYKTKRANDSIMNIAYIGDSWAFMHRHDCIISKIIEDSLHLKAKVYSFGVCGLTSKSIYENIFDNSCLRHFMQERNYKYCFVSAGINDTNIKMSTAYYRKSMNAIIRFMLSNNIHPIILEIPDYDILRTYERQTLSKKVLRHFSMAFNNTPLDCKQQFRDTLNKLIAEKGYQDKISIIRFNSWNNDYSNDLHNLYLYDHMHLNEKGYKKLDSIIAKTIITHYSHH